MAGKAAVAGSVVAGFPSPAEQHLESPLDLNSFFGGSNGDAPRQVRERMHAARTAARGEEWDKSVYSRLDGAATAEELAARADEIRRKVASAVWSIGRRKGWG